MPTTRPDPRREGVARVLVGVLLCAALTGCSFGDDEPGEASSEATVVELADEVAGLLSERTRAVRRGRLTAFLDGVDPDRRRFAQRQRAYFLNLRELPLARYRQAVDGTPYVDDEGGVRAVVVTTMQLAGYDDHPVTSPALYTFTRDDDGALVVADDRDAAFAERNDLELAPWELGNVEVEEGDGVLGVFDDGSVDAAYQIMASIERGIEAVEAELPVDWDGQVVVYALSDIRVLAELDNLPGGDPDRLDGVAFPVRGGRDGKQLAATRFMLHPRMIDRNDAVRDRLIRHELTHVALGRLDDRVPTWLSEGIAEYVSVQPVPPFERRISREAVLEARAGLTGLPEGSTFNGPRSGANYGIAWYACEHVATVYGEEALWRLFDEMRAGEGTPEAEQDAVLRRVLGIGGAELAAAAGQKIVDTFG